MKKTKLKLSRQTVRLLSAAPLSEVHGGYRNRPTYSCMATICCPSLLSSCKDTDCCLEPP
jgi:hypothetical protein